jgi:hypothetical protein
LLSYNTYDSFGRIFSNNIRRMNHIKLLRGVLASECQNRQLTTGMIGEELRHVQDLAVEDHLGGILEFLSRVLPPRMTWGLFLVFLRTLPSRMAWDLFEANIIVKVYIIPQIIFLNFEILLF